MQVKSLTPTLAPTLDMTWLKANLRRAIEHLENAYHRIFGCWHMNMSRPFTISQQTYRMCLNCGARRVFDVQQWKMVGPYYVHRPRIEAKHQPALTVVQPPAAFPSARNLRRAA